MVQNDPFLEGLKKYYALKNNFDLSYIFSYIHFLLIAPINNFHKWAGGWSH